jgi:outer membrane protein OmpA-like peptidoglycan-associated protein
MKHRILIALPLAAALMVPAYAQQNTPPSDQNQPAATQAQPADQQSAQPQTSQPAQNDQLNARQPLTQERHEGFWGKLNPFARKKYVQRQMEPIRNRVNELDELTANNSKAIKDVDSRAQEGIRVASAKATEADQHAVQAGNTAQQANQTAQQASTRLQTVSTVVSSIDQYKPETQTEIRFRSGQMALSKKAKEALDQMAEPLKNQKGYVIEVQGFSAGSGRAAVENSQQMAQSVVRYLVLNHEIPVYRIYVLGMGNAPVQATTEGAKPRRITSGGRVEISLLKNSLEQLNTAESVATPGAMTGTQGGISGTTAQPSQQQQTAPQSNMAQPSSNQQQTPPPPPQQ